MLHEGVTARPRARRQPARASEAAVLPAESPRTRRSHPRLRKPRTSCLSASNDTNTNSTRGCPAGPSRRSGSSVLPGLRLRALGSVMPSIAAYARCVVGISARWLRPALVQEFSRRVPLLDRDGADGYGEDGVGRSDAPHKVSSKASRRCSRRSVVHRMWRERCRDNRVCKRDGRYLGIR